MKNIFIKKNVELVLVHHDIDDEDITKEYMMLLISCLFIEGLKQDYEEKGFNDNSEQFLSNYKNAFNLFESEFEI